MRPPKLQVFCATAADTAADTARAEEAPGAPPGPLHRLTHFGADEAMDLKRDLGREQSQNVVRPATARQQTARVRANPGIERGRTTTDCSKSWTRPYPPSVREGGRGLLNREHTSTHHLSTNHRQPAALHTTRALPMTAHTRHSIKSPCSAAAWQPRVPLPQRHCCPPRAASPAQACAGAVRTGPQSLHR